MKEEFTKDDVTVGEGVHIASDGKKFDDEERCAEYEKKLIRHEERLKQHEENLKRAEQYKRFKEIETKVSLDDETPLDGREHLEHFDYRWFRPRSTEEVELLNAFFRIEDNTLSEEHIGEWVCIEDYDIYNSEEVPCVTLLKDSMKHIKWFLNEFGYDISSKEKEEQ